ncbi:MAG: DNA polymerase III subunit beta [Leptospira sp.]|nr:DNA polymerase III subunit beta [Leptospira sp.]
MKFRVKTTEFQKAINAVEGVISVREIKSILSNVKVEAENDKIFLSATDLEISIKASLNAKIDKPGNTSLPAKQLNRTFKEINFSETLVETDSDQNSLKVKITDAEEKYDFKAYINSLEGDEIKTISKVDESKIFDFPCHTFMEMIRKTSYSVAQEDTRFVFNGLFLTCKDRKVSFVGTDGRRLAKIDRTFPVNLPFEKGIIVPHKAIKEIAKMIDSHETGKIGLIENQVYISIGSVELLCKLIEGSYPDYDQVIPKSVNHSVKIGKENLTVALRQAIIAAEEPSKQIRVAFKKNILNINSSTAGASEVSINIPIDYNDEETVIAFKGDYLSEVIRSIDDSEIIIEFTNQNSPVIFKDPGDAEFISIIMPMKI